MKPVITAEISADLDAAHENELDALMERAGYAVAMAAVSMGARYGSKVVVLAGPGNNGGDGYVAARVLRRRGVAVTVRRLAEPRTDLAKAASLSAANAGVPIEDWNDVPDTADLIVDALFGGRFHGELPPETKAWAQTATPVLAVDVPSGVDASTGTVAVGAFRADRTVTFHASKVGHWISPGANHTGTLEVADIGLTDATHDVAFLLATEGDAPRPRRSPTAHKWSSGSVIIVGGSPGMGGAALLAGRAALASGAGAVSVSATEDMAAIYRMAPELLTSVHAVDDPSDFLTQSERFDVVVAGPGLAPDHGDFIRHLVADADQPLVLDAGALAVLTVDELQRRPGTTIVTPHAGEFERLTSRPPTHQAARELAQQAGIVVLLKGSPTFVADPAGSLVAVTSGGPELATIGTGDVLAGAVAAFVARGLDGATAAISAAFWHGEAGAALAATGTVTADRLALELRRWVW